MDLSLLEKEYIRATDIHLATLDNAAMRKATSKHDMDRFQSIAVEMLGVCLLIKESNPKLFNREPNHPIEVFYGKRLYIDRIIEILKAAEALSVNVARPGQPEKMSFGEVQIKAAVANRVMEIKAT